jgi:hypothetical protein
VSGGILAVPVTRSEAQAFVLNFHRHSKPPLGGLFQVGASDGLRMVGVAIVGRPVARGGVSARFTVADLAASGVLDVGRNRQRLAEAAGLPVQARQHGSTLSRSGGREDEAASRGPDRPTRWPWDV